MDDAIFKLWFKKWEFASFIPPKLDYNICFKAIKYTPIDDIVKLASEWQTKTHPTSCRWQRNRLGSLLWQVHDVLGRGVRVHANMDAMRVLLFHRLPLQDSASELRRHLPTIRTVPQNSQARASLYQPVHIESCDDQYEG
jgi:hypothetical protein